MLFSWYLKTELHCMDASKCVWVQVKLFWVQMGSFAPLSRRYCLRCIGERIREQWDESSDTETKWSVLKAALCEEAKEPGVEDRRQPDWFRECGAETRARTRTHTHTHTHTHTQSRVSAPT